MFLLGVIVTSVSYFGIAQASIMILPSRTTEIKKELVKGISAPLVNPSYHCVLVYE